MKSGSKNQACGDRPVECARLGKQFLYDDIGDRIGGKHEMRVGFELVIGEHDNCRATLRLVADERLKPWNSAIVPEKRAGRVGDT